MDLPSVAQRREPSPQPEPLATPETFQVPRLADDHLVEVARCVNDVAIAGPDADVIPPMTVHAAPVQVEEDQVTDAEVRLAVYPLAGVHPPLAHRRIWQATPEMPVDQLRVTGAVFPDVDAATVVSVAGT